MRTDAKELVWLSGGLPVVLEQWGAVCRDQSMGSFLKELRQARGQNTFVDVEGGGDYDYGTFFAGMEVQLLRLEVNDARIERCCCRLAVLPEDTEMPLSVAAMLWGVDDVDAAKIARKLEGQNLVNGRRRAAARKRRSRYSICTCSTCGTAGGTRSRSGTRRCCVAGWRGALAGCSSRRATGGVPAC